MNELTEQQTAITSETFELVQLAADKQPSLIYIMSLSEGSRRAMQKALNDIAELLLGSETLESAKGSTGLEYHQMVNWGALRGSHTQVIRSHLAEKYSARTANKYLSALRGTLKEAWRLEYMTAEQYQRAVDIKSVKVEDVVQAAGRQMSRSEILALMGVCAADDSDRGIRDAAVFAVAIGAGLRRSEIAELQMQNYDQDECKLTIKGKGNKKRTVYISASACEVIDKWLDVRGVADGSMFWRFFRGGKLAIDDGLTDQAVYEIMRTRAEQAGIEKVFSPHDFRRTYAGELLDAGVDIVTVQKLMGHANANTTANYDRRGERAKKAASQVIDVPIVS